ncbi:ABC transporter substrate-binding protein [Amycolatopsis cihanbeyliensis]|uniref:NitT/TauT family transport system substrate-binding protein n=1 Tax=Amycolatopsis cihanbeyliensis TaxID=1128664 RepID=A0A542DIL5_AMYCI|nr:ABC transporter substrate-binding protein [Amycolatopsis cihanbeyliensis]TQJ02939.1 NitT/TauT family transport system substrate-binding protein [Amycolatopsis cihanbeyliensis]
MRAGARYLVLPVVILLILSGCSLFSTKPDEKPIPEQQKLRVGVGNPIDTAPLRLAVARGRFERAGLTVELVEQANQDEGMAQLRAGELDVAFATDVAWFEAASEGTELRLQGEAYTAGRGTMALMTLPGSIYQEPMDLLSPRIAVDAPAGLGTLTTRSTLGAAGAEVDRIRFTRTAPSEMAEALRRDEVHAAWMVEPYLTEAQKDLGATVLADTARGATTDFPMSAYAATTEFARTNPRTLALFRRVLGEAQQHANDPTVVRAALPELTEIDETTASLVSLGDYPVSLNGVRLQRVADLMHSSGMLPGRLDVQPLLPERGLG